MNRPPAGSFIWYELLTTDPDAAARFYGRVIGWQIAARPESAPDDRDYRMIGRADGGFAGGVFGLRDEHLLQGVRPTWLGYLHVHDVDAATAAIVADGGKLLMPRLDLPVGQIAMLADPLGTPFYAMNPIPPPGKLEARSDVFDPAKPQHVRWNELASPDQQRAKDFYAKHFGFEFNEAMPMGEMGDYCFIDHGGQRLGAVMQRPPQSPSSGWLFYFGVPSVTAARQVILDGGGEVTLEPHEVPGGEWIVVATDPQGAPFGVVGPRGL